MRPFFPSLRPKQDFGFRPEFNRKNEQEQIAALVEQRKKWRNTIANSDKHMKPIGTVSKRQHDLISLGSLTASDQHSLSDEEEFHLLFQGLFDEELDEETRREGLR